LSFFRSGKSSLLEALTGVQFPVKSGTCTRVPIRVRCRKADDCGTFIIQRGGPERRLEPAEVGKEIGEAQAAAILEGGGKGFSKRSLHLEARGPEQMELILVDLPGLIHHGPDVDAVTRMVESFVARPQALILLVGEAKQDTELAAALALAEKHDPTGKRTLRECQQTTLYY